MSNKPEIIAEIAAAIPTPIYYLVGGATASIAGLIGWVYKTMMKKQDKEIARIEEQTNKRITTETSRLDQRISRELDQVNGKLDQISNQLLIIASNTSRRSEDLPPHGELSVTEKSHSNRKEDNNDDQRD